MTTNKEWEKVCKEWCKQENAELLFVNDNDFGCMTSDGKLMHIYSDELYEIIKNRKENS